MAQTTDRYLKELKNGFQGRSYGNPGNAQFYFGQLLMQGSDDGLIKPVSGSTVTPAAVVGVSHQTSWLVSSTNPLPTQTIEYGYGCFDFASDGTITTGSLPGRLLYASDTQTLSLTSSAGPVAGRLVKYQPGLQFPVFAEIGPLTSISGSTV